MRSLEELDQEVSMLHEWVNDLLSGLHEYTVDTLPTGKAGRTAYVSDADTPVYLTAVVGGGSTVCPVFFDGTNWIAI